MMAVVLCLDLMVIRTRLLVRLGSLNRCRIVSYRLERLRVLRFLEGLFWIIWILIFLRGFGVIVMRRVRYGIVMGVRGLLNLGSRMLTSRIRLS